VKFKIEKQHWKEPKIAQIGRLEEEHPPVCKFYLLRPLIIIGVSQTGGGDAGAN